MGSFVYLSARNLKKGAAVKELWATTRGEGTTGIHSRLLITISKVVPLLLAENHWVFGLRCWCIIDEAFDNCKENGRRKV